MLRSEIHLAWVLLFVTAGALWSAEAPKKDADPIVGTWRGSHTAGGGSYQHMIKVEKRGAQYAGIGLTWHGMSEAQAQRAMMKQLQGPEMAGHEAMCVTQQWVITLDKNILSFRSAGANNCYRGASYNPDVFSGEMKVPGILAGEAADAKKKDGRFRLCNENLVAASRPAPIAAGKPEKLECLDDAGYHYTCYLPNAYDAAKEWPVLMNFNPGGDGKPLSTKMADEAGWIMVGLTESKNGPWEPVIFNRDAVLFDLRRRFNVNWKRVYFSGLSGGARAASRSGCEYPDICAGIICIGAAYAGSTPPKEIPIFFIVGKSDGVTGSEVPDAHRTAKAAGRKTEIIIHPGGHDWGRAEDHEAAIRWLEKETAPKPAAGARAEGKK